MMRRGKVLMPRRRRLRTIILMSRFRILSADVCLLTADAAFHDITGSYRDQRASGRLADALTLVRVDYR